MGSLFRSILGCFTFGMFPTRPGPSDYPPAPADVVAHVPGLT